MVAPTSSPAGSEGAAALVVALAAAVGGALGWGGARLCDSLVRLIMAGEKRGRKFSEEAQSCCDDANWTELSV